VANNKRSREAATGVASLQEITSFIEDYYSDEPTRDSVAYYFADSYLNNGFDKTAKINRINWPFEGINLPVSLDHFSIEEIKDDETYSIRFKTRDEAGVETQHSASVRKYSDQWEFVGNQYLSTIDVSAFNSIYILTSRAVENGDQPRVTTDKVISAYDTWEENNLPYDPYDVNDDEPLEHYGNATYGAGIDFGISDNAGHGFQMVVVEGHGLAESVRYIADRGLAENVSFTIAPDLSSNINGHGTSCFFTDSEIGALPENNLVYTFKVYDSYDQETYSPIGDPIEVRTIVVPKPPLTRAETWKKGKSYYSEITNLPEEIEYLSSDYSDYGSFLYSSSYPDTSALIVGDEIQIEFSNPEAILVSKFDVEMIFSDTENLDISSEGSVYYSNSVYESQEQTLPSSSSIAIFPKRKSDDVLWMKSLQSIGISVQDKFNRTFSYSYIFLPVGGLTL
jgi:hypothetical protein